MALNKTLRDKPADPLAAIAGLLFKSAQKSYPVFDRFEAKRVFLHDNMSHQSLSIKVFLQY